MFADSKHRFRFFGSPISNSIRFARYSANLVQKTWCLVWCSPTLIFPNLLPNLGPPPHYSPSRAHMPRAWTLREWWTETPREELKHGEQRTVAANVRFEPAWSWTWIGVGCSYCAWQAPSPSSDLICRVNSEHWRVKFSVPTLFLGSSLGHFVGYYVFHGPLY